MSTQSTLATPEAEIRDVLESWQRAVVAGDLDKIMSHYAPEILSFDAIGQLQFKGVTAYRNHWEACIAMCPGLMVFEIHELGITASGDVAFCHYLCRCGGTDKSGEEKTSWMRVTVCLRKKAANWLVVHEHFSVPFEPQSGNALMELQP